MIRLWWAVVCVLSVQSAPVVPPHITFTVASTVLGETRRINVFTPQACVAASCPILYMPDGGVDEDFPHVAGTVDALVKSGDIRPVVVVGIENTERRRDMTGPTEVETERQIAPRIGGASAFRAFIRDELMPAVARRVRGTGETAIIGESLAGLFILDTFFTEPAMFDHYIAFSPSLFWNRQQLIRDAPARLRTMSGRRATVLYTTAGDDDLDDGGARLAEVFRSTAPPSMSWTYRPMPAERHSTIYRAAEGMALKQVFGR